MSKKFDLSQFDGIIGDFSKLDGKLMGIVEESLLESAEKATQNLTSVLSADRTYPADAVYSLGLTKDHIITPEVKKDGKPTERWVKWGIDGKDYKIPFYVAYGVEGHYQGSNDLRKALFSKSILQEFEDNLISSIEEELDKL